jgi:DNA-binding LytR/AlgR family response regulator
LIKCIIVEDEILAQEVIQAHLQRTEQFQLVGVCNNALEAQEVLSKQDVDLIFLDIQLPGMTGLSFLRTLQNPPLVVLTTAYPEYALESYEFNIIDYLLKPVSFERFSKAVNKIAEGKLFAGLKINEVFSDDHIFIKSSGKFFKVNFSEIMYVEGMKDYLKIHTHDYTLVTHQTMSEMEKTLPSKKFLRVHKSYIIALASIKSIYGNSIEVNKTTIPIGINHKDKVLQLTGRKL